MKNISRIAFAVTFFMFLGGGAIVNACPPPPPTPLARFVLPTNTTATAVAPTFKIITSHPIDTTSVHWCSDTTDSTKSYGPTLCVIPYDFYQNTSDTLWPIQAVGVTGTIINDTTIEFTSGVIGNNFQCEAILMGLRVISGSDTIIISDTVARMNFTTIGLPIRLISFSFPDSTGLIHQHDTLSAYFSTKLDSVNSPSGPLISLTKPIVSVDTSNDSVMVSDSDISTTIWLDASDSSIIHMLSNSGLTLGVNYSAKIKLSGLTADTTQDGDHGFTVRKSYRLNIIAVPTGGLTCLDPIQFDPSLNVNYLVHHDSTFDSLTMTESYDTSIVPDSNYIGTIINAGDTVTYTAPTQVGGAVFKQWTGSGILAIDTSTNPVLTISETANQLNDLNIVALYARVPVDTICVATAGANTLVGNSDFVEVRSDSLDCPFTTLLDTCASTSSLNYSTEPGKTITLTAFSTSDSIQFDHWSSSDTNINGQTSPSIAMQMSGNACATATFSSGGGGGGGSSEYLHVRIYNMNTGKYLSYTYPDNTIATITVPSTYDGITKTWTATSFGFDELIATTLKMVNPGYGLDHYTITYTPPSTGHNQKFTTPLNLYSATTMGELGLVPGDGTYPISLSTDNHKTYTTVTPTYVTFYVKQIYQTLTLVVEMGDGNLAPPAPLIFSTLNNKKSVWCVATAPAGFTSSTGINNRYVYTLAYPMNTSVSLTCGAANGFTFDQWGNTTSATTGYDPNNTNWPLPQTNTNVSFTMNENRYVTAVFNDAFVLQTITFKYVDNSETYHEMTQNANNWPPPIDKTTGFGNPSNNVISWTDPSWNYSNPVAVELTFSSPVISRVITASDNGEAYNITTSQERKSTLTTTSVVGSGSPQTWNATMVPGQNNHTILFYLRQTGTSASEYIWKGQTFSIDISNAADQYGNKPSNAQKKYNFETVGPDVRWRITQALVYNLHRSYVYPGSNSWLVWAAQYSFPVGDPFSWEIPQGIYSGGASCWDTIWEPGSPIHLGNNDPLMTTATTCLDDGLGLIMIGSEYSSHQPNGGYVQHMSYNATCSAGVLNSVVNPIYSSDWYWPWVQYDYGHRVGMICAQKSVMGYDFGVETYNQPPCLTSDEVADIPDKIGDYIHNRLQCSDAQEIDYYDGSPDGNVGWWENFRVDYQRAGQPDFWGAGTHYMNTYKNVSNNNTAITFQVDVQ